jgi:hypothetical protein
MRLSLKLNQFWFSVARCLALVLILLPTLNSVRLVRSLSTPPPANSSPFRSGAPREEEVHTKAASPISEVRRCFRANFTPRWMDPIALAERLELAQSELWLRARNTMPIPTAPTVATPVLRGPPCA